MIFKKVEKLTYYLLLEMGRRGHPKHAISIHFISVLWFLKYQSDNNHLEAINQTQRVKIKHFSNEQAVTRGSKQMLLVKTENNLPVIYPHLDGSTYWLHWWL